MAKEPLTVTPLMRRFILHWGEMGARWGINRTVAQIHALLYLSPRPLDAGEIGDALEVARSNVSTSLRELQSFGIVKVVHVMGDRRDRFESLKDVWEMFRTVLKERKRRECDPTLEILRECLAEAEKAGPGEAHSRERLKALLDFFETMNDWYEEMNRMDPATVLKIARLGVKLRKFLGVG